MPYGVLMTVIYLPFNDCSKELQASACSYVNTCLFGTYDTKNITVASIHQKVVGILVYGEPTRYYKSIAGERSVYLLHIKVNEECRRQGIATSLVKETLQRLNSLNLFIEVKLPKEGTSEMCAFIGSLKNVRPLQSYCLEKETYMRYIVENESDDTRGGGKAASP